MSDASERIPIPPAQRWELVRERVIPAAILAATLVACAWLWQKQAVVASSALGQVQADSVEVFSPVDGDLIEIAATTKGSLSLFAPIERESVVARIQPREGGAVVEIRSPLTGVVVAAPVIPGQFVQRGQVLARIASRRPNYIVCHLLNPSAGAPQVGADVAVRTREAGAAWHASKVAAVGPSVEPAIELQGVDGLAPVRGLPVQVTLPEDVDLLPGSVVEVRFAPARRAL